MHSKMTCRVRVVFTVALIAFLGVFGGCQFETKKAEKMQTAPLTDRKGKGHLIAHMMYTWIAMGWPVPDHWWDMYQQLVDDSSSMGDDPYEMTMDF